MSDWQRVDPPTPLAVVRDGAEQRHGGVMGEHQRVCTSTRLAVAYDGSGRGCGGVVGERAVNAVRERIIRSTTAGAGEVWV